MEEEKPAALTRAREELDAAAARLRRLKRSVGEQKPVSARPERWRVVRRMIESLREVFSGWAAFREEDGGPPDQQRTRRELEARALRAESALAELEARGRSLDDDRERVLAELERVHEGWRLLRQAAAPRGEAADERTMSAILGRLQTLVIETQRALTDERAAQREASQADRAWRWIVSVAFPTFEQRLTDADTTMTLPTMRRLIKELDRGWTAARQAWKSELGFAGAIDEINAARKQIEETQHRAAEAIEGISRESEHRTAQAIEGYRRDSEAELERTRVAWRLEVSDLSLRLGRRVEELETAVRSLESANAELLRLREGAEAAVEPLQRERATWQQLAEAARGDLDRMLERAKTDAAQIEQLNKALNASRVSETSLAPSGNTLEQGAAIENSILESQPSGPSLDPVLEPAWQRVLDRLRQPLDTAMAHLRRLFATPMPDGHRAVLRLSAGSIAQATDLVKSVREFLDEGANAAGSGRLETAVESALAAWEPALAKRGIVVARVIGRGLPSVGARTESLRMAAYHLIRNSYEALPNGGSLAVKVWKDQDSGEARASFADSGPGLGPDPALLFSPFLSPKPGHLGLGLALARRIARRAGGDLEPGPVSQRGALLTLRLPAEAAEAPAMG